ncbi:uroporphyrinogen-III C-methyltransferase [Alteromonas stellipolaris]|uniref:uroporphyrinogen-III C-methyltransferase n=1 Tax=Alteromonas stellipolaris TaxID=233316 RepID=UPI0026E3E10F|nr:uroporphyrinogen-III C-methyltransferase [Alteromonas stellipolaris]MDO6535097.1 uroporphyrinogen-III C-methyltransferase [Alteromonas stellipolaris]MDO6626993.1 uroporphyrinogen-III C-methyltransferase [Alteromonas stellipolaris]MDP2596702.1 uroporphyrinogen-III C-methyltransferase [Alteromonas stellipolaris]
MSDKNEKDPQNGELVSVESSSSTTSEATSANTASSTDTVSPKGTDKNTPKKAKKSSGTKLLWFVVIVIFLLVLGIIGAGYWYYMQQQGSSDSLAKAQQANTAQVNDMLSDRKQTADTLRMLNMQNGELKDAVDSLQQQNSALVQQAEATQQQLNSMEGQRPADWLIAEADYLVRMAGRKLWLENDVRTATLLLVNADKRLKSLADPSVLPVRAKLAEDIQTLQQMNPVSQSSVALALTGMLAQIDKLPLDTFEKPVEADADSNELSESADDWKENLAKVWHSIVDGFLTVKSLEGPVEPVMSLQAQFLVKEQLRLQLMHAQSAALKADPGLYEQSLLYAKTMLEEHYDVEKSQVTGFISALDNLVDTDISQPIPSQLVSQKPLEQLLESRVKQAFSQGANAL